MSSTVCSRCQADISSGSLTPKSRPEYLERVNPLHADIPSLPERYSESSDHYWYFGFPVSIEEARALVKHYASWLIREPASDMNFIIDLHQVLAVISEWDYIAIVNVQPDEESAPEESANDAPTTSASAVDSGPAERRSVTFYAVMSTEPHEFVSRPSQEMLNKLTKVFKRSPVWMEDTRVNLAHADIPSFPERYSKDSDYNRYYGFALSVEEIQILAKRYVARRLNRPDERPTPKTSMMIYLLSFCKQASGWHHTCQVLVKPVPEDANNMIQDAFPSPNGHPTVIFFSIVMEEDRFESRPDQEQIDTLSALTRAKYSVTQAHLFQRVHPQHAKVPALPARYSPTSDYYWHFGFPVSITGLFDVQPEEGSADNVQTVFETLYDRRAASFHSLMSTETEHFVSRPGPKEVEDLTTLFRKQPVWREDAIEKEM
ncbi:hypothetical protein EV714DRAFT_235855 [Schizophyllum commune]